MTTKEEKTDPLARRDENMWAMFCHVSAFAGFVIPFGNIIAPLIIWTLKKDEYEHVNDQGKEALNFQISITIYVFISFLLIFVAIGIPLLIITLLFAVIFTVIGGINANDGIKYRYPFTLRLIN